MKNQTYTKFVSGTKKKMYLKKKKKKKRMALNEWPIKGETTSTIPGLANAGIW